MGQQDNTVVLRVQLNEEDTEKRLAQLSVKLADTRKASTDLTAAYKAGQVSAADFGQQSVKLNNELRATQAEQRNLTKTLDAYRAAQNAEAGSYEQAQRQLDVAQQQFRQVAGSQDLSSESAKALSATIADLRGQLTQTDSVNQLFVRNVGNYPKGEGLDSLIQSLVKVEEVQKAGILTAEQSAQAERAVIGFKQQIAQAGAQEGLSYEQTTAKVQQYGAAIRPATTALVQLEKEQQQVAEGSEAFNQIGFKIASASKQIQQVPKEVKGVSDTLLDLDNTTGAFGGQVANLKQRFTAAKEGIELARGGFVGLKGAIASTGLGVLILALGSLYEYFTKSDEGAEDLAAGLAYLKGLFSVLESVAIGAGKGVALVFKDPLEAGKQLLDFLENNLINRVKSFGVLWEAIKNGDATKLVDSAVQFTTGITDATAKGKELTAEMKRTADAAYAISRATDQLEDHQRESLNTIERNKNAAAQLLLTSKDVSLSDAQRLKNLDKASELEGKNLEITKRLAREKLAIAKATNDEAERTGKTDDALRDAVAQAEADVTRLIGESNSFQQTVQNRRSHLVQDEANDAAQAATKQKAAAEKAAELRLKLLRESLALESQLIDRQLQQVKVGSDEELSLQQQKLEKGYQLELAQKDLTVKQKLLIDRKYEDDSLALALDFNRRRLLAVLQAEVDLTAAQLSQQQAGSDEALRLQTEQIENQRRLTLAGLDARADNEAKIAAINAQAAQQRQQAEYADATRLLNQYLDQKRQAVELDYAKGVIQEGEYQRRLLAITKAGTDAQAVVNADYNQSNVENAKKTADNEAAIARQHTAEIKRQEEVKQEIKETTVQAAEAATDAIIQLFGQESAAGQAALITKKTLALAEIALNLQKELSANALAGAKIAAEVPAPAGPILGTAYTIAKDALAIAAAASAAASVLKLQRGGIAYGPSHAQGGIPLYHQNRPAGIEIEGGEAVLTANVTRNPLLLNIASLVNQAAGGRPLTAAMPTYNLAALGAITRPVAQQQLRGAVDAGIDYDRLAQAMAKVKTEVRVSQIKTALTEDARTVTLSNS